MTTIVMHITSSKKKLLLILFTLVIISSSCSKNGERETNIETSDSSLDIVETTDNKIIDISNEKAESDNSYKYRDEIFSLVDKAEIFNITVNNNTNEEGISLHVSLINNRTNLKDLDSIKVGLSVQEFDDELYTNIEKFYKSKKYWEIKLNNGVLEEQYDIDIDNNTNLLSDEQKELLKDKNKSIVLRFDIYVDENSPVRIYNHFINSDTNN